MGRTGRPSLNDPRGATVDVGADGSRSYDTTAIAIARKADDGRIDVAARVFSVRDEVPHHVLHCPLAAVKAELALALDLATDDERRRDLARKAAKGEPLYWTDGVLTDRYRRPLAQVQRERELAQASQWSSVPKKRSVRAPG